VVNNPNANEKDTDKGQQQQQQQQQLKNDVKCCICVWAREQHGG